MKIGEIFGCALLMLFADQVSAQGGLPDQLSKAIYKTDVIAVRALLGVGAPVKVPDSDGFAPLVSAVMASSDESKTMEALDVARALLESGADIEQQGPAGNSPLSVACSQVSDARVAEFLLDHGARVDTRGYNDTFPLYQAIRKNRAAIAEVLMTHGADVKMKNADGETALHYAALNGMHDTATCSSRKALMSMRVIAREKRRYRGRWEGRPQVL